MNDDRYSRQTAFQKIGEAGQKVFEKKHVTIVGSGALGTVCAEQLARAGIGKITIIDKDLLELSNLQRQVMFTEQDIGKSKAILAAEHLNKINSTISATAIYEALTKDNADALLIGDVVLDCTDRFYVAEIINNSCAKRNIPWVHGSAAGSRGMVIPFTKETPCLNCIFRGEKNGETAQTSGILGSLTATVSSLQVVYTMHMLLGNTIENKMHIFDIWKTRFNKISTKIFKECPICQE